MNVAKAIDAIPLVASSTERATLFATPAMDQRVFNKATGNIERWNGSAWIIDFPKVVTPQMFGAAADGVTDDSAAFALAVAALPASGGTVLFPPGFVYGIGAPGFSISNKTNVKIVGDGAKLKLLAVGSLLNAAGNPCSIRFDTCTGCSISGFEIDGNAKVSDAISLKACTDCVVERNRAYSAGFNGIITAFGGTRNTIRNNITYSAVGGTAAGIYAGDYSAAKMETDVTIVNNISRNNTGDGIIIGSVGGRVQGNHCYNNFSGIVLGGAGGFSTQRVSILGNVCKANTGHGIQSDVIYTTDADIPADIVVQGNVCSDNGGAGMYLLRVLRWAVTGNTCRDNVTAGITASRFSRISLLGNTCCDTRVAGARTQIAGISIVAENGINVSEATISGNVCSNNTTTGISLGTVTTETIDSISITGNTCNGNGARGIDVTESTVGNVTNTAVVGNVALGNTTTDIRVAPLDVSIEGNKHTTQTSTDFFTFTNLDTTPSVKGSRRIFKCANNAGTVITAFDDGRVGQQIEIYFSTANTTINHGGNFILKGAANVTPAGNTFMRFIFTSGVWIEQGRSF